jgi:hypothetical protein
VVELVDARDSKSREGNLVSVRFRPPAPSKSRTCVGNLFLHILSNLFPVTRLYPLGKFLGSHKGIMRVLFHRDVVAVQHGRGLVARDLHDVFFRYPSQHHIAGRCPAKVVEMIGFHARFF